MIAELIFTRFGDGYTLRHNFEVIDYSEAIKIAERESEAGLYKTIVVECPKGNYITTVSYI